MKCKVPGCGKKLYYRNLSGLCRGHNHALGYCTCAQCGGAGFADPNAVPVKPVPLPPAARPAREGVRQVNGTSLPKEPWLH